MRGKFTFATRKSPLALAQSRAFVARLSAAHPGVAFAELHITTSGDRIQDRPLNEIGGKGLFVKEIEEALLDGRADFAVHSSKDVPPELAPGLAIECFPERVDARDVLVTASGLQLDSLPAGSRIGTTSLRRRVQLAALRPDLQFLPLRGNVDTRLRKCREGQVDAVVLARAGLLRLELDAGSVEVLEVTRSLPAVGQGALAIEQRTGDVEVSELLAPLSHSDTKIAVLAERGVLRAVEGDCQTPVAAYAERRGSQIWLRALLAEPDGSQLRRDECLAAWPETPASAAELGEMLGKKLRAAGQPR
ncbi:MAG TPA: hydroxymethylbilane synthase [Polyangiaceae bacterium]|jgi:hydroxymethylbilane synthase